MPQPSSLGSLSPDDPMESFALGPPPPVGLPGGGPSTPKGSAKSATPQKAVAAHSVLPGGGGGSGAAVGKAAATPTPVVQARSGLVFPLFEAPLANYKTGARWFGAPRSGGRHHAAVDLIAPHLTRIRAVADGVVVQAPYYFYTGTNALEVNHPGVGVVRYGEIDKKKVVKLKAGDLVRAGDVIAYVGRLDSGSSMLHFELYSGKGKGPLTVRGNPPYQRRSDLINPTSLIDQLLPQVKKRA